MSTTTTTRQASVDEIATEMDRRGAVIEQLEARLAHIDGINAGAIDNLRHSQRQLDADGIEVGVSRQALCEVLAGMEAALSAPALRAAPAGDVVAADWRDDPSADERWNAGLDFGQTQLCAVLGVDPQQVNWDAATETLDGDVQAVIGNILTACFGDDWRTALSAQGWRTMESAPKGVGGYNWMLLLHGDRDDPTMSVGMRYGDRYFAASTFYVGGPANQRQYAFREVEIVPFGWMPLPAAPTAQGGA